MIKYVWKLEYNGTKFCGWQKQPGLRCVQSDLEDALMKIVPEKALFYGASRTDSCVHAQGQIAHTDLQNSYSFNRLFFGVQNCLQDIIILDVKEAPQNFHARYSAIKKYYIYKILNRRAKSLFLDSWHIRNPLNIENMQQYANIHFLGTKDFSKYCSSEEIRLNMIKTISCFEILKDNDIIEFHIEGNSFLMHQIRLMISKLMLIGLGRINDDHHSFKAPGYGLYLNKIIYNTLDF